MSLIYTFDLDTAQSLLQIIAQNLQKRRLEKNLSREALSQLSGVPAPTIAKFEQKYTISLASFVALAKALGYAKEIKALLSEPQYSTMEELENINKNKTEREDAMNGRANPLPPLTLISANLYPLKRSRPLG